LSVASRVVALLVLAVLVGSCGTAGQDASPVATTTVDLPKSYRFEPAAIVVKAGATVTWTNSDNFTHSVQLAGEASPGLVLAPGERVDRAFPSTGTYAYVCAFHAQEMRGTVIVSSD
jgi:plastocyanin